MYSVIAEHAFCVKKSLQENFYRKPSSRVSMGNISKSLSLLLIVLLTVSSLNVIFATIPFGTAQSGTNVTGIINSDTTWTQANSPYDLTENVLVSNGATLTIEAGVTVNFYTYDMQVNGTLNVQGTIDDKVYFTTTNREIVDAIHNQAASINFGDSSLNDVIEGTVFGDALEVYFANCNSSIILNNDAFPNQGVPLSGGFIGVEPTFRGPGTAIITNDLFTGRIQDECALSTIANNTFINGGADTGGGSFLILNDNFTGDATRGSGFGLTIGGAKAVVSDNYFSGYSEACIAIEGTAAWIQRNFIQNNFTADGYPFFGIEIQGSSPVVENNTITNCNIGIDVYSHGSDYSAIEAKPTIINNNIYNNAEYNLYLGYPERSGYNPLDYVVGNIDAFDNYWGTTNNQAINQTIHDLKNQSNLGTVNFIPLLSAFNTQATPNPDAPTPTVQQIPTAIFLGATNDNGGTVELTVNGNLTIFGDTMANVTANQSIHRTTVSFTVMGYSGTNCFGNITIPKSAVPYGTKPTVYINNNTVQDQNYTQDTNNYYIWFTPNFNEYLNALTIEFATTSTVPKFPTWIILPLFALLILLSIAFIRKRISKKNITFLV
jgi:hypothetical protein